MEVADHFHTSTLPHLHTSTLPHLHTMRLYTAGYRDAITEKRLEPEKFYGSLPEEAVVIDIRSHAYSPFAPCYTGKGVAAGVEMWKPDVKTFVHLKALGNTRRESSGKRIAPPV